MSYKLWIDDLSYDIKMGVSVKTEMPIKPPPDNSFFVATTSAEAIDIIKANGVSSFIDFDFDLGVDINGDNDTVEPVLKLLTTEYIDCDVPSYNIHSENVAGQKIIRSVMESWKKYKTMP